MVQPTLSRITVYPIKSLDGHDLTEVEVLSSGALQGDRRFALVDAAGKYINGKRCALVHTIRATYSDDLRNVTLSSRGQSQRFQIHQEQVAIAAWCGKILGFECRLVENASAGFPDDTDSPGPTIVSTATLESMSDWFPGLDLAETRRRFRFNFEVANTEPFWEDLLVSEEGGDRRFRIGKTYWQGGGICQRCVVPSRHSQDGTVTDGFAKQFSQMREATLPAWSPRRRFDHFYRLGVNTALDVKNNAGKVRVGDAIEMAG